MENGLPMTPLKPIDNHKYGWFDCTDRIELDDDDDDDEDAVVFSRNAL